MQITDALRSYCVQPLWSCLTTEHAVDAENLEQEAEKNQAAAPNGSDKLRMGRAPAPFAPPDHITVAVAGRGLARAFLAGSHDPERDGLSSSAQANDFSSQSDLGAASTSASSAAAAASDAASHSCTSLTAMDLLRTADELSLAGSVLCATPQSVACMVMGSGRTFQIPFSRDLTADQLCATDGF